jgi:hypothetical protein
MASLTITFRAKLAEFSGGKGYKVPELKPHHVTHSGGIGSMAEADIRQGRMGAVTWWLARKMGGYRLPGVVWAHDGESGMFPEAIAESADWTITPVGNGYMADVSRTFSQKA